MTSLKFLFCLFALALLTPAVCLGQSIYDTLRTVRMTALADNEDINLTIQWQDDPGANTYSLYKKLPQDTIWGNPILITDDQDTSYLDTNIEEGKLYEYRMIKQTGDTLGYAYLFSGVNYLPTQRKGDLLLLIDSVAANQVANNLAKYIDLLTSEGWRPHLLLLSTTASVPEVKSLILQEYASADSLTAVLLMGNIAIPHSGDISPDGHTDHIGAWPADLYYGDMDGVWTDQTVNDTLSAYPRLHNIPGDGNFDQAFIPGKIELAVGRLDFSELPVFNLDEYQLLDRYLEKNMAFRTGTYQPKRRAVIKNRNPWTEGLGQNGIRNFVPLVSPDSIVNFDFFDAFYDSFLWSYGGSSGSMTNSLGLGNIGTYANNNFQCVFTSYFGSYYGDYDFENAFLRTILGSGKVLSTAWVGAPNWFFHAMGLGMDLGFCTLLTQNNTDLYYGGYFPQSVTINLLGDPTLTAFIVEPPQDLKAIQNGNQVELSWSPSEEDQLMGYQVYKKREGMAYFEAVNLLPVSDTSLVDSCVIGEESIQYLVKAVKREITPSGSFINHSTGPIINLQTSPNILPEANFDLSLELGVLKATNLSTNADQYQWVLPDGTSLYETDFEIPFDQTGDIMVSLIASNACFSDTLQQVLIITNVAESAIDKGWSIYPNPAQNFFTIETAKYLDQFDLYNMLGIRVFTDTNLVPGAHIIDIQNLTTGEYLLKIHAGDQVLYKTISINK